MGFEGLIAGYRRFREHGWSDQRERWTELCEGQSPKVMIIACSDSRVEPAQIFDARPGEMFVVRNVAALVPPFEPDENYHGVSAALEFAVTQLEVPPSFDSIARSGGPRSMQEAPGTARAIRPRASTSCRS